MKKRFILSFVSGLMALLLVFPAFGQSSNYPQPSQSEDRFYSSHFFRDFTSTILDIDAQQKTVLVRKGGLKTIRADKAVIVLIRNDNAQAGSFADLRAGQRAHFLVKRQFGIQRTYDALVITQALSTTPPSALPQVQFSLASHSISEDVGSVTHTVNLSKVSAQDVRVRFTLSGTATGGGVDYSLPSTGELTIPAGQMSVSFSLVVVNDSLDEPDETVIITLSNPINATLGSVPVHTHTIVDND